MSIKKTKFKKIKNKEKLTGKQQQNTMKKINQYALKYQQNKKIQNWNKNSDEFLPKIQINTEIRRKGNTIKPNEFNFHKENVWRKNI